MSTTVYLVMDQHGMQHRVYFAKLEDAQAYRDRCIQPPIITFPKSGKTVTGGTPSFAIIPFPIWDSLAEFDEERE